MDKETPEIVPKNLDGSEMVVNTVQKASADDVKKAAEEEKERKQNYYVDPLEQDALMKEKLEKIEAEKAEKESDDEEEHEVTVDETIRPDMNVSGYFSTGKTATKAGIMQRSASADTLTVCVVLSVISAIYSALYAALLISTEFNTNWFLGWIFAVAVIASIFVTFNSVRSLKVKNNSLKQKALIGIVGAGITAIPLIAWLIHWLTSVV